MSIARFATSLIYVYCRSSLRLLQHTDTRSASVVQYGPGDARIGLTLFVTEHRTKQQSVALAFLVYFVLIILFGLLLHICFFHVRFSYSSNML